MSFQETATVDNIGINTKAFGALHNRLLQSGKVVSGNVNVKKSLSSNPVIRAQQSSSLYNSSQSGLEEISTSASSKNLGKGWFNLEPMKLDAKLKNDIKMIQMRNYIDPKRFYKNPDKLGAVVHIGTVIEGPSEYKSARLTNRERRQTIVEEILSDKAVGSYSKQKFGEIQAVKAGNNKRRLHKAKKSAGTNRKVKSYF